MNKTKKPTNNIVNETKKSKKMRMKQTHVYIYIRILNIDKPTNLHPLFFFTFLHAKTWWLGLVLNHFLGIELDGSRETRFLSFYAMASSPTEQKTTTNKNWRTTFGKKKRRPIPNVSSKLWEVSFVFSFSTPNIPKPKNWKMWEIRAFLLGLHPTKKSRHTHTL